MTYQRINTRLIIRYTLKLAGCSNKSLCGDVLFPFPSFRISFPVLFAEKTTVSFCSFICKFSYTRNSLHGYCRHVEWKHSVCSGTRTHVVPYASKQLLSMFCHLRTKKSIKKGKSNLTPSLMTLSFCSKCATLSIDFKGEEQVLHL